MAKEDKKIKEVFSKHILPLHQKMGQGTQPSYLKLQPEESNLSYYEDVDKEKDCGFSFFENNDEQELSASLSKMWKERGNPELLPLAQPLAEIAFLLKKTTFEQSSDVSEYVYVMH